MSDAGFGQTLPPAVTSIAHHPVPVIVTFDEYGAVIELFGDVTYYAEDGETLAEVLSSLLVGWQDRIEPLAEVEMPSGRYADVRIVPEGTTRHVVLFDVTASVLDRREILQASHELAIREQRQRMSMERRLSSAGYRVSEPGAWNGSNALEVLSWDIQAQLEEIDGHVQLLDDRVAKPSIEARSLISIKRALMQLHALTAACVIDLRGGALEASAPEPIELVKLASELRRQFGQGEQPTQVAFEAEQPFGQQRLVVLDYARTHQILACLITCFLDVATRRVLVRLRVDGELFVVDVQAETDDGVPAIAQLQDDPRYLASLRLAASMNGSVTCLAERAAARVELPLPRPIPRREQSDSTAAPVVLVAVDAQPVRERVLARLAALGSSAQVCEDLSALEAQAADARMIVLGGTFAGATGMALSYRLHAAGVRPYFLLLRPAGWEGSSAWVLDGRRTVIAADADDEALQLAIEGGLQA